MKVKTLQLEFTLEYSTPRPFSELRDYGSFVFYKHINMAEPDIQIKLPNNSHALLIELVTPPWMRRDCIFSIEGDPLCLPLNR